MRVRWGEKEKFIHYVLPFTDVVLIMRSSGQSRRFRSDSRDTRGTADFSGYDSINSRPELVGENNFPSGRDTERRLRR